MREAPGTDHAASEADALVVDRYLDALLAATDRRAYDVPADAGLDPAIRRVARLLRRDLVRVHPSFRFEERLAARIADAAARASLPVAAGAEGSILPMARAGLVLAPGETVLDARGSASVDGTIPGATPAPGRPFRGGLPDPAAVIGGLPRQWLIGGALTSAALSIGAYVALRGRTPRRGGPMTRAARAAHEARSAALAAAAAAAGAATAAGTAPASAILRPEARSAIAGAVADLAAHARARLD